MTQPTAGELAGDAPQWWRAYVLAERDQADELRDLAAASDDHARRQLAWWLSERAGMDEAIEVIRPLADAGDDVAELWLARWLADCDLLDELRRRAAGGGYRARLELARRLAERNMLSELRELAVAAGPRMRLLILRTARQAGSPGMDIARLCADLGDEDARHGLIHWLARTGHLDELQERAESGDDYARRWLAEALRQRYRQWTVSRAPRPQPAWPVMWAPLLQRRASPPRPEGSRPGLCPTVGGMPAKRKRPTPEDAVTARRILLDGLARDASIAELAGELAPLHPRDNTFPRRGLPRPGRRRPWLVRSQPGGPGGAGRDPRTVPARVRPPRTAGPQAPVRHPGRGSAARRSPA